jgi:hypothetical protein
LARSYASSGGITGRKILLKLLVGFLGQLCTVCRALLTERSTPLNEHKVVL